MSVIDIHSYDDGTQLEELDFAGVVPQGDGPDYEQLLAEDSDIFAGVGDRMERSAFEDGSEVGQMVLAQELLEHAPGGFSSQAEAARWARWAHHRLNSLLKTPKL